MNTSTLSVIALLSPVTFALIALISGKWNGYQLPLLKKMSVYVSALNIVLAGICAFLVIRFGLLQTELLGVQELGLSLRLDPLSVTMLGMIALLGFIVVRFSLNYLDGDNRQNLFLGRLAATIASVQLLVLSGNLASLWLAWVLTSLSLHQLLVFYPNRPRAVIAARKKFIVARFADASLLGAAALLYLQFGSGNLEVIFEGVKSGIASANTPAFLEAAAVLLAIAALLKSAQFPSHGWLVEVMETPTPVSALLHAGLLNAGPFLIVRMATVMNGATMAPNVLIVVGGFTALFASVTFLTQPSVKTALGYSSIAHMGFSLLMCGMGVYSAAMLHLVAHSFYKAHAFLSSGSVVEVVRASGVALPKRLGNPLRIAVSILIALCVYVGFSMLLGVNMNENLALLATGAIIVMGLSQIIVNTIDVEGQLMATMKACFLAMLVATAFFSLEAGSHYLLQSQLPESVAPSALTSVLILIILAAFGLVVVIQLFAPSLKGTAWGKKMAVHFRNGLYANALFDRMVGALYFSGNKEIR